MRNKVLILLLLFLLLLLISCQKDSVKSGYQCLMLGDYVMAIDFFNEELRKDPRNFDARAGMGKALLQKSFANDQDTVSLHQALVHLQAARSIEARDELDTMLKDVWLISGRARLKAEDTIGALISFTFALDYDPTNVEALNFSGIIFSSFGHMGKADSLFTAAMARDKNACFNAGMAKFYGKKYNDAVRIWKSMLKSDSSDISLKHWITLAEQQMSGINTP